MKMREWFKSLEKKQKRVAFYKLGEERRVSKNKSGQQTRTCWQSHHGEISFSGAVGAETKLKPI